MSKIDFKIAVVATAYTPNSHADVIVRRWLNPHPNDSDYEWTGARTRIVSMAILQRGDADMSRGICRDHEILECESVATALTLGSGDLAVDGVMIIGEHGEFPENEFQQKLYPRKELLDEVLAVFDGSKRVAPIFFDKHFSWSVPFAREMYDALAIRKISWFGGSSISLCPMLPPPGDLRGEGFEEVVITTWNVLEAYLFHGLEVLEAVVEQRRGGESGIAFVIAWEDEMAWAAMDRGEFSQELLEAALGVSGEDVRANFQNWLERRHQPIEIFQLRYKDGLKATIVRLNGITRKWAFACRIAGREHPVAAAAMAGNAEQGNPHFARLARRIEDFFLTGISPVPPTRLYLTTLACAYCLQALAQPGIPLPESEIVIPA